MNTQQLLQQPFIQIALPIIVTFIVAAWLNNRRTNDLAKRLDDLARRLDRIEARLDSIEKTLREFGERITRLEERTSPLRK